MLQTSITSWLNKKRFSGDSEDSTSISLSDTTGQTQHLSPSSPPLPETRSEAPAVSSHIEDSAKQNQDANVTLNSSKSFTGSLRSLPSNVKLSPLTSDTLPQFRRLNSLLLPVPYPDRFYDEVLKDPIASSVTLLALWLDRAGSKSRVVAGIRCRVLTDSAENPLNSKRSHLPMSNSPESEAPVLYISTIGALSPYRGHGLAAELLRLVVARAIREHGINMITAHVSESNEEGREWYSKRGFSEVRYERQYYRRLRPSGAWFLERKITPSDLLGHEVM